MSRTQCVCVCAVASAWRTLRMRACVEHINSENARNARPDSDGAKCNAMVRVLCPLCSVLFQHALHTLHCCVLWLCKPRVSRAVYVCTQRREEKVKTLAAVHTHTHTTRTEGADVVYFVVTKVLRFLLICPVYIVYVLRVRNVSRVYSKVQILYAARYNFTKLGAKRAAPEKMTSNDVLINSNLSGLVRSHAARKHTTHTQLMMMMCVDHHPNYLNFVIIKRGRHRTDTP